MAEDQATFDTQLSGFISDLQTQVQTIITTSQAILDKVASQAPQIDLSAESAQLTSAQQQIDSIAGQLPTSPTAPPTPTAKKK